MRFTLRLTTGSHRDGLWKDGTGGLYCQLRADRADSHAPDLLIGYLAGTLRIPTEAVKLSKDPLAIEQQISVKVPPADLQPILASLPTTRKSTLFDTSA